MPTNKKPRKRIVTTFEEPEPESIPVLDDPDEETLSGIVNQFGPGDVSIKVYKLLPTGREYCYTAGPETNEETIRASGYGPGKYLMQVLINGEFRKAIPIGIAAIQTPSGVPVQQGESPMMQVLLSRLSQLEQRLSNPREQEPINAVADALVKLNTLGGRSDLIITVETIIKCQEIGQDLGGKGGDDWKGILADVVKEAMPVIGSVLAQRAVQNGGMAGTPAPTQAALPPAQEVNVEEQMKAQLKAGIDFLKQMAIIPDSDPGLWVDVIVARRNEQAYAQLIHKAIAEEFSAFIAIDPTISSPEYQPFFRSIYDGIRSVFSSSHPVADDPKRPTGNKGNTKGNGRASA